MKDELEAKAQLGISLTTARYRLRRLILFDLVQRLGENICYHCGKVIQTPNELSMEHKHPWLGNSTDLFWSLNNVTWSHIGCNSGARRGPRRGGGWGASKVAGVSFATKRNKWKAEQRFPGGRRHQVGYYDTEAEAVNALETAGGFRPLDF